MMTKSEFMKEKKKSKEFDFEKDLSINKFRLDEECLSHSSIYFKYAEACQEAKSEVSRADDNLKLVMAEKNLELRNYYAEKGVKTTEALITADLEKSEEVQKAKAELREAQEIYGKLSVAVQAMDSRRSSLDNLVKLYVAGYYSVSNGSPEAKKSVTEQVEKSVRNNLNSKE